MSLLEDQRLMAIGMGFLRVFDNMAWDAKLQFVHSVRKCTCPGCVALRGALGEMLQTELMGRAQQASLKL